MLLNFVVFARADIIDSKTRIKKTNKYGK